MSEELEQGLETNVKKYFSTTQYTIGDMEKCVSKNDKMQILQAPWIDDLMDAIKSGEDIEGFIRQKNEKHYTDYLAESTHPIVKVKQRNASELATIGENVKDLEQLDRLAKWANRDVTDLATAFPEDRKLYLRSLLSGYAQTGKFSQRDIDLLAARPKGLFDNLKNGKKIKEANVALSDFMETCKANNVSERMMQAPNYASSCKYMFDDTMNFRSEIDLPHYHNSINNQKSSFETRISQLESFVIKNDNEISVAEAFYHNETNVGLRDRENQNVRNFAQQTREELLNPPQLKISDYVEGLDKMADDEMVMFNFAVSGGQDNKEKFDKIVEYQGLKVGRDTDNWYVRMQGGDASDCMTYEVWSPVMTAKEAKENMPSFVRDLDRAGISQNLIIPMKASDMLKDIPIKEAKGQQWINDQLLDLTKKMHYDRADKESWKHMDEETKAYFCDFYGEKGVSVTPPEGFGAKKMTLEGIMSEYGADTHLFSGTCVSDDYCTLSCRAGRNGTLFATPNINYARIYDGVGYHDFESGKSATGDFYTSTTIGEFNDKKVQMGFINVYEQSPEDRFFKNFGCDDTRRSPKEISRAEAIDGYWNSIALDKSAETFVTKEKNPLVAKIMHVRCDNQDYYVKVPENPDELTKYLLNRCQADIKDTFKDFNAGPRKQDVLDRLALQREELVSGKTHEKAVQRAMNSQKITEVSPGKVDTQTISSAPIKEMAQAPKILSTATSVNARVDKALDQTIEAGSNLLNNTKAGKAYEKMAEAVADTKVVKTVEKVGGKIAEAVAETAVGKAVGKAVTKTVAKTASSAVAKSVLKKIPLVSLGAGCYFAWQRVKEGDFKGACGEVASGTLGCFPGLGTAASTALDIGLAAKDIKEVIDSTKAKAEPQSETVPQAELASQTEQHSPASRRNIILEKRGMIMATKNKEPLVASQQRNLNFQNLSYVQGQTKD